MKGGSLYISLSKGWLDRDIHLQQGFKSRFNKAEREDTIRSVCRMNRVTFHIAEIVEEDNDITLWPCIDHGKDKVDPLRDVRVTQAIEKEDPQYFLLKTWPLFQGGEETMDFRDTKVRDCGISKYHINFEILRF